MGNFTLHHLKSAIIRRPWLYETALRVLRRPWIDEVSIFRQLIRRADMIFDVGANAGQLTFLFACLTGPRGAVHAFEPVPETHRLLAENIRCLKPPGTIFLNECAVGDNDAMAAIHVPNGDFTQASLSPHSTASWVERGQAKVVSHELVNAIRLDTYVRDRQLSKVDFIKCDVEGAELLVIKGARTVLTSASPPILFLEVYDQWTKDFQYEPRDLLQLLNSQMGYEVLHVGKGLLRRATPDNVVQLGSFPHSLNYLCYIPHFHHSRIASMRTPIHP